MKQLLTFLICLIANFIVAQNPLSVTINKISVPITIDGVIDSLEWQNSSMVSNFNSHQPYDTSKALTKTEVWICYDNKNIYVAAKCYDSLPEKDFIIQSLKRDFSYPRSDAFSVILDPVNDKTNGFSFAVNPFGAQREGLISNGGRYGVTTSWDNKWFSKVTQHNGYWIVEMAIPFKTIRYKENITEWGINFSRNNLKINESSAWAPVKRQFNIATLPNIGKLTFADSLPSTGLNYSLIPYVSASANKSFNSKTNTSTQHQLQIGGDAKLALTPSLNLDLTINPDYSQVEVDRQVTNLTKFNVRFPEQRRFFIENSDLFSDLGFRDLTPFFSRKIGVDNKGGQVPIYGGARISGKIDDKWRTGSLYMLTEDNSYVNNRKPYFMQIFQKSILKQSNVTAFYIDNNQIAGLDFNYISKSNKLKSKTFFHNSFLKKQAYSYGAETEYNSKNILTSLKHEHANQNYVTETGFTARLDQSGTYSSFIPKFQYKFYPNSKLIINHGPGIHHSTYVNSNYELTEQTTDLFYAVEFQNKSKLSGGYKFLKDSLFFDFDPTRTNSGKLLANMYHFNKYGITYTSDERKLFFLIQKFENGGFYNGTKFTSETEIKYRHQPWGIFSVSYDFNKIELPKIQLTDPAEKQSFSGNLHLLGAKAELSFTKNIYLTTYFQYNTQAENLNSNIRFQYRFRPMSDFFLVYTDNYDSVNFDTKTRGVIAKFIYWW